MILQSTVLTKRAKQSTLIQIDANLGANLVFCHEQPPLGHTPLRPFVEESTRVLYLCARATVFIKPEVRRLILSTRLCHGCGALWPERTIFFMSPVKEPIYNCEIQSIKSNAPSAAFPPSAEHITKCHNALRIPGDTPTQSTRMSRKINTWSSGGQNKPLD